MDGAIFTPRELAVTFGMFTMLQNFLDK